MTGPVTLTPGDRVTADNVVAQTMQTAYVRYASDPDRAQDVPHAGVPAPSSAPAGLRATTPTALVKALGRGVAERRLLVYSDHPDEQRLLGRAAGGRGAAQGPGP